MKVSCEIIKDLLPLYHDGVCSNESRQMVEEHLSECEKCRLELKAIDNMLTIPNTKQNLDDAKAVKELSKKWKYSLTKSMMYGALVAFLVNNIAWVYLWFVNNTGNNIVPSILWCIVNIIWLIAEIICSKKSDYPVYKNWRIWICSLFFLIALFTLAIYLFSASMP